MRILFVTMHMEMGGIRKSLLNLLYALKNQENIKIDLLVLRGELEDIKHQIAGLGVENCFICEKTNVYGSTLKLQKGISSKFLKIVYGIECRLWNREKVIRRLISHAPAYSGYDVAISYTNGIWTKGSVNFSGGCEFYVMDRVQATRKLAWIHSDPARLGFTNEVCQRVYSKFDAVVNVSKGCKQIFDEICPELVFKSKVFYNLCGADIIRKQAADFDPYVELEKEVFKIVTVCRLDNKSKRIDRAIKCAAILKKEFGNIIHWTVVGNGIDNTYLRSLAKVEDVDDIIFFVGEKDNPYPYVKNADVFVLTSDYEAFSITVKEALLLGVPVVLTPIPSANELIVDGESGYIADFSSESVADRLKVLINTPEQLQKMKNILHNNAEMEDCNSFIKLINGQL
ncbi:glycosyltransferase [Holdemania massiliensis]|uniref:glycosyltransferase n=1 Tax=Holdemania massiliensis TaxID=1468449 RepID=UPI0002FC0A98|nr:glycosyltransferase [Holdemania massiliensis]